MQSSSSEIALVPYTQVSGAWTLDDAAVLRVGQLAHEQGLFGQVFVDGGITTPQEFLALMQDPRVVPIFAFADDRPIGVAWLSDCSRSHAFGHFLFLKKGRGDLARRAGRLIIRYWMSFEREDGPLFPVILGLVPSRNTRAIRYALDLGFVRVGEIPKMVKRREASTLLYYVE